MGLIIQSQHHAAVRILIGLPAIGFLAFSPIIISVIGANISESITGEPCHEGNCFWGAFGWLFLLSMPVAFLLFIVFVLIVAVDLRNLNQPKQPQ